jgi:SapC
MTTQLLIYESVVPLSVHRHGKGAVEAGSGYAFSGKTNSVPLMAVEFPFAASEYPIVFAGTKESFTPAVILGVRESQNLYLTQDAKWEAKYIPAFVRRYPFVFTKSEDEKRLVLCIDEAYEGFNQEGRGNRLFGEDDKPTEYVQNILKFLQEYQAQFERTQAFCARIRELDLLEPMQAQVEMRSGEKSSLTGFLAVNRARLKAVGGVKLAELANTDELELIYLHLQSMRNFQSLPDRLASVQSNAANPDPATPAAGKTRKAKA